MDKNKKVTEQNKKDSNAQNKKNDLQDRRDSSFRNKKDSDKSY